MATTTNYGWTTPDDTALVKDGASAIRTLGSSVDTTTKALNPSTTLGDIEYRSSTANTNTRLGIGTTGQVLTVAGGVPSWGTAGGGLALIQRSSFSNVAGTSTTFDGVFSSTYVSYLIAIENLSASTGTDDLQIVFRHSAADGTEHYGNVMSNRYNASTWANTSSNAVGQITIYTFEAQSGYPLTGNLFISNVGASVKASMTGHLFSGTETYYGLTYGYNNANNLTGFRLKSASTNITGTVAVYGLAK